MLYDVEGKFSELFSEAIFAKPARWPEGASDEALLAVRAILNLVVYLHSDRSEVRADGAAADAAKALEAELTRKTGGKRKRLQRRLERASRVTVTYVGESSERGPEAAAGSRDWRTIRGHWHRHWTGSRMAPDGTPRPGETLVLAGTCPYIATGSTP